MAGIQHPRLLRIMRSELEMQQLQLSSYCRQQIEQMIGYGITRMRMDGTAENAGFIMRAESNLKGLITYLGKHARKIGTFPTLSDGHFDDAIRHSPAFWPYCMAG